MTQRPDDDVQGIVSLNDLARTVGTAKGSARKQIEARLAQSLEAIGARHASPAQISPAREAAADA